MSGSAEQGGEPRGGVAAACTWAAAASVSVSVSAICR